MLCKHRSAWTAAALAAVALISACAAMMGRPPKGAQEALTAEERAAIARVRGQVDGQIVWSSSREGHHDIYLMKTDGTLVRRLTKGQHVDWYPRFSGDGKRVLFTRSAKPEWVAETDANRPGKWDLYTVPVAGGEPQLLVKDASWGAWTGDEEVVFARHTKVVQLDLARKKETVLADSTAVAALGGADLQNPHLSPDRRYLTITLRGARRETGIYDIANKSWTATGKGCQINWAPAGDRIYWINPSGNGGSETFSIPVKDGKPAREFSYQEMRFIDIPGRQSHEYFPQLDREGRWLVWAATRRGHDHDIADYDIFIWRVGAPPAEAARLTFHSANDRWPDIFIPAGS